MARRIQYDLNAAWDDPTERAANRREVARAAAHLQIKIAVRPKSDAPRMVGTGIADNLSTRGMYCRSKHQLEQGQPVEVYISLKDCPREMGLPRALTGGGHIVWIKPEGERVTGSAIRFDDDFADDIHLALYVDYLSAAAQAKASQGKTILTPSPRRDEDFASKQPL
jgi:hypothetical protein